MIIWCRGHKRHRSCFPHQCIVTNGKYAPKNVMEHIRPLFQLGKDLTL